MSLARAAAVVAAKDLRIEARGRYALGAAMPFAATLLVSFGLALGPGRRLLAETAPGLLWLSTLFASVLAFGRSYEAEGEDGALETLVLAPLDKAAVFLGKAAAVAAELLVLQVLVLLMVVGLFDVPLGSDPLLLAGALVLGTIGLAGVGSLFGALTESARAREAVFPLLVLPLSTPILVAGVRATSLALGADGEGGASWLGLLVAFDVVLLSAGTLVYGFLLED